MDKSQVARGFLWNTVFTLIGRIVLPLAIGIALARILGPANLGAFAALSSVMMVLDVLRDFGINQNFIVDKDADAEREGRYFGTSLVIGGVFALCIAALAPMLAGALRIEEYVWGFAAVAFAAFGSSVSTIPGGKLQKLGKFKEYGLYDTLGQFIGGVSSMIMAAVGMGAWSLILAAPIRTWFIAAAFFALTRPTLRSPNLAFVRELMGRWVAVLTNSFISLAYTVGDTAIVTRVFGKEGAGLYSTAFNVGMKPVELISWPLGRTMAVAYSQSRNDVSRVVGIYYRSLAAILLTALPIFALLFVNGTAVMTFLYGAKFAASGPLLSVFCVYLAFRSLGTTAGGFLVAMQRPGLSNFGWLGAFAILGYGFFAGHAAESLPAVASWFTAGAVFAFSFTVAIVAWTWRPTLAQLKPVGKALAANLVGLLAIVGASFLPIDPIWRLVVGGAVGFPLHLMVVAQMFTGSVKSGFSKSGLKRIWEAL